MRSLDRTDARLLLALALNPRTTGIELAERLSLSRNTVQARLQWLESGGALDPFDVRVRPTALGYPLTAFITTQVNQHRLAEVAAALQGIPEILEVFGLTGATDLLVRVVARDADDLYRIANLVLASPGVERTNISLAMRELVSRRVSPLLQRLVGSAGS
jgi:DNA-binding Lrp family transcriptional regulator